MTYDVIIIGGSYAGIAAATQLARARRRILVVDGGQRRNRFAGHSHGFLTQDGTEASAIASIAREQLLTYSTVDWLDARALSATQTASGFRVHLERAASEEGTLLILALGVKDQLPEVPGLAKRWGQQVFHCPYCHGYELEQGRIGVLASSPMSLHQALMLPDWGSTTLFLNGAFEPDATALVQLAKRAVTLERERVVSIENRLDMVLEDGRVLTLDGLFTASSPVISSPLATQLGCEIQDGPLGELIVTGADKQTRIRGVFACGDAAHQPHNVSLAVADGVMAGTGAHRALMFEGL